MPCNALALAQYMVDIHSLSLFGSELNPSQDCVLLTLVMPAEWVLSLTILFRKRMLALERTLKSSSFIPSYPKTALGKMHSSQLVY